MGLTLHESYSEDDAIFAFDASRPVERHCDGDFAVLPTVVLCLAAIGEPPLHPYPKSSRELEWHPKRLDYVPDDRYPWFPEPAREVWSADRKTRLRDHHVFLRLPEEPSFVYAGGAHMGRYFSTHSPTTPEHVSATFTLDEKLPRDLWLRFGGYPGWEIEADHRTHHVHADDIVALRRLLDTMAGHDFAHLRLTRYEGNVLSLFVNRTRGWVYCQADRDRGGRCARDEQVAAGADSAEYFHCACGIELEFPTSATLPRDRAIATVAEYFAIAQLPGDIPWAPSRGIC